MADAQIKAIITAEDRATGVLKQFGKQLEAVGKLAAGGLSLNAIKNATEDVVKSFSESQAASAQLGAVLQSTGGIAGVTANQAEALAKSLQQTSGFSDEAVLGGENLLLTFTNIGRDIFPQATQAIVDVATALHEDLSEAAIQVGKALQDPILGMTNLRRIGVNFNKSQQEMVAQLVETGHGLEAQKFILAELGKEYGGSALAMSRTFSGQMTILANNVDDVKERMGQLLADTVRPLVLGFSDWIRTNGELAASLGIGVLAAGAFGAAVVGLAGAIGLAVTIMGGPFTIILGAIAALLGVVVFKAAGNLQAQMRNTTKGVVDGSKDMKNAGANNFGATGQAANDLAQRLADLNAQMTKTTRDFRESLAQIVVDHRKTVADLQQQLGVENKDFAESQATKEGDFKDSQATMLTEHQRKVRDIENQLKDEQIANNGANFDRVNSLRLSLAEENDSYNQQFAKNALKYEQDTAKATQQHEQKKSDLQARLDEETAFIQKHNADIASIQDVQLLDEIDKLKRSHAEQMVEFENQKQKIIASGQGAAAGYSQAFADVPNQLRLNAGAFAGVGTEFGNNLGGALWSSFKLALVQVSITVDHFLADLATQIGKSLAGPLGNLIPKDAGRKGFDVISDFLGSLVGGKRATGGPVEAGKLYQVNENGPEYFKPSTGGTVIPMGGQASSHSNTVININMNVGAFVGSEMEKRKLAETLSRALSDAQGARGMQGVA